MKELSNFFRPASITNCVTDLFTNSSSNLSDTCSSRGTSQDGTSADTSATRTTSETSDSIYDSDTSISSDVTIKSSRDTQVVHNCFK